MQPITLEQALLTLDGTGPVLQIAREVSRILRESKIEGAVIGGIAVALHGYVRTTVDVDVFVASDTPRLSQELEGHGFIFDAANKQFIKNGVPVHLVTRSQLAHPPREYLEIDGVQTISLADLINIKLRSGSRNILRAQDLGDAIGLIRHHRLSKEFTPQIDKPLREEFRKLVEAIERETESR